MEDRGTGSGELLYGVIATLPDAAVAREYVAWLDGGHVQGVLDGGASASLVVRLDGEGFRVASLYTFPNRAAFDAYERDHAPALREDGRRRFGDRGVEFERVLGDVTLHLRR